ncbi:hypothetical protein RB653_006807 [Dictyostelium firmibasis]|uniref:DDRGK domain-containing protein 1 n=1 Tax=Dictyostelium firmibasis TaxID=79012 RepID=A0AAN7YLI4_9MYCE
MSDIYSLVLVAGYLSIFLFIGIVGYLYLKKPISSVNSNEQEQQQPQINIEEQQHQQPAQFQRGGIGRMNLRNRRQPIINQRDESESESSGSDNNIDSDNEINDVDQEGGGLGVVAPGIVIPNSTGKKIGKKKLEKLKLKDEKRKAREYQEHLREEKKKTDLEKEEALKEKRLEDKENERLRKEEEERIRLEKERKEDEEYNLLKGQISLEGSGITKNEDDDKSLLQLFIKYLKEHKICLLEDIAIEFNIKTNDVIDRIKTLDKQGLISGVIDDRGKFIYITKEEMEAVAKFVNKKGRVNIEQIALESNRLIDLTKKVVDNNCNDEYLTPTTNQPTPQN